MRVEVNVTAPTYEEAFLAAGRAFAGFFKDTPWKIVQSRAEPSLYATGNENPELWACHFEAETK